MTTEIETNIEPKKRGRKPGSKNTKPKASIPALALIDTLEFLLPAQKKAGSPGQQFSMFRGGWAVASDGILTIGTPAPDAQLEGCPHTVTMIEALKQCEAEFKIVQVSDSALWVGAGEFAALVPCVPFAALAIPAGDAAVSGAGEPIKLALGATAVLTTDGAPTVAHAGVLLQNRSAVGTNGHAILEYWHGVSLPDGMIIPRNSALAVAKCKKELTGFGYGGSSATFWFKDGSFIKTQLFAESYPNYAPVIDVQTTALPLPAQFWEWVETIDKFSDVHHIYFGTNFISAKESTRFATKYDNIEHGLPQTICFNTEYLKMLKQHIQKADFRLSNNKPIVYFFGENVRGALMGIVVSTEITDDDIPF